MVAIETQVTDEEARRLEALARERAISVPELVHQAVAKLVGFGGLLATDERRRRAAAASGCFRSGVTDLAVNHDAYLAEAFEG